MNGERFFRFGEEVRATPYRYRACGLDGIYLLNGYELEDHDGEQHVSVTDMEGLHRAIGRHLVLHRKALAPKELRFLRNTMDMTQDDLGKALGQNSQSVARWEKGQCEMPGPAEKLLRAIFLASLLNEGELEKLRDLLVSKLGELDQMDEVQAEPVEFEHGDHWYERMAA